MSRRPFEEDNRWLNYPLLSVNDILLFQAAQTCEALVKAFWEPCACADHRKNCAFQSLQESTFQERLRMDKMSKKILLFFYFSTSELFHMRTPSQKVSFFLFPTPPCLNSYVASNSHYIRVQWQCIITTEDTLMSFTGHLTANRFHPVSGWTPSSLSVVFFFFFFYLFITVCAMHSECARQ